MGRKYEVGLHPADNTKIRMLVDGQPLDMNYDTAIRIAVMLRGYGGMAKQNAGDFVVKPYLFANLTDGVAEALKLQKKRDSTAHFFKAP